MRLRQAGITTLFSWIFPNGRVHRGIPYDCQYGLRAYSHRSDLIVMQSTLSFATTVLDHIKKMENTPLLKDIFFFWNKLKKRTNVEILKSYSEVMRELHLTVLDSTLPDLCRYEKEITHAKRAFFRCTLLPPPARQLEGSGLVELAEELMVKLKLGQS